MAFARQRTFKSGVRWTGVYLDPDGRKRAAGSFATKRDALRAAHRQEQAVLRGQWHDGTLGAITFQEFVERDWLPSKHIEATTRAAYVSNLNKHFFPFFGHRPIAKIPPSLVQDWVTHAAADGLSPRSIRKYHTMLHSIFKRAVRDQLIVVNPCEHTELPKVIARKTRTLTPDEFDALIHAIPEQHRLMVETAIETGMRWGELIALRPRHIDFLRRTLTVEETIVEVSTQALPHRRALPRQALPQGQRTPHLRGPPGLARRRRRAHQDPSTSAATTCSSPPPPAPRSPATPSAPASGSPPSRPAASTFAVRIHDLRHAHASWLLAGGSDLK